MGGERVLIALSLPTQQGASDLGRHHGYPEAGKAQLSSFMALGLTDTGRGRDNERHKPVTLTRWTLSVSIQH